MANARLYESWGSLTEALRTGRNQNEAKESGDLFAALYADPDRLRGFLAAMSGVSLGAAQAIAAKFPWKDYKTFTDIGAAQGMVAATLAGAHPHLSGAGYDLPEVKPVFEEFIAKRGVSDRVKFLAGNFFMDPLPAADVLIMGHILHDWDLPQKRMLLEKAHAALPKGGALIVYEFFDIVSEIGICAGRAALSVILTVARFGFIRHARDDQKAGVAKAGFRARSSRHCQSGSFFRCSEGRAGFLTRSA
jgi:hypothetical protein